MHQSNYLTDPINSCPSCPVSVSLPLRKGDSTTRIHYSDSPNRTCMIEFYASKNNEISKKTNTLPQAHVFTRKLSSWILIRTQRKGILNLNHL